MTAGGVGSGPPFTARSVLLSVLLGSHPPELPVRVLVRVAELFGIAEGTTRVALSRLSSDGDVVAGGGTYRLSERLLDRQRDQDSGLRPDTRPWDGSWELAVARPDRSGASELAALGTDLARLRLAELRPGVWARPDNLIRDWPAGVAGGALRFEGRPGFAEPSPRRMVARLWDLDGWAATAVALTAAMDASDHPADRFVAAAAMVRHIRLDPVLPPELLPDDWPGTALRAAYDRYRQELTRFLARERDRRDLVP